MGTPYNLYDALRGTGSAIGRAARGVGRGALAAGRFIGENSAPELLGAFTPSADVEPTAAVSTPSPTPIAAHAQRLAEPPPPAPINRAAIRASDMRAQPLAPGLARSIDIPPEPTDIGTFVSPGQREENRRIAAAHAFESPEWKTDYSQAQNAQDEAARADISNRYRAGMERTAAEDQLRGNPMERAIQARQRSLAYEDLLPADATSRIRVAAGGRGPLHDFGQEASELGTPTLGEYRQNRSLIAQAAARQDPEKVALGNLGMGRGRIAERLSLLRQDLDQRVQAARGTPDEAKILAAANEKWTQALNTAKVLAEIMKSGYPSQPDYSGFGTQQPPNQ